MNYPLVLADTGAIYALLDKTDKHHEEATAFYHDFSESTYIVIEYVIVELMTLLRRRGFTRIAVKFREELEASQAWRFLPSSPEIERATFAVYRRFDDKAWSYTDCALLAVSRMLDDAPVFSFDHHIKQMGVMMLPVSMK